MRIVLLFFCMAVLFLSGCNFIDKDNKVKKDSDLLIGWASRDISPEKKVNIAGQMHIRISEGIKDPVTVTALAITSSKTNDSVIFVSCDLVQISDTLSAAVKTKLGADKDIPSAKIIMNATHTHTSSDVNLNNYDCSGIKDPEFSHAAENVEFISEKISEAVREAWAGRKTGSVAWAYDYAVLSQNRRTVYSKDMHDINPGFCIGKTAQMYGPANTPLFSHLEGSEDHQAQFLFTFDSKGNLNGALINVACPSQETEGLSVISADYWHETRELLRKEYGKKLFILPQCSAAGDLSPHRMYDKNKESRMLRLKGGDFRMELARRIKRAFDEAYSWGAKEKYDSLSIVHDVLKIDLTKRVPTEEEYILNQKLIEDFKKKSDTSSLPYRRCCKTVADYESAKAGKFDKLPVEVHVVKLGPIVFSSNRFELFLDYGARIQARSPAEQTFIIQLAGEGSYLPSARAEAGGGYSASVYCNLVGSLGGQELVEATVAAINKVFNEYDFSIDELQNISKSGSGNLREGFINVKLKNTLNASCVASLEIEGNHDDIEISPLSITETLAKGETKIVKVFFRPTANTKIHRSYNLDLVSKSSGRNYPFRLGTGEEIRITESSQKDYAALKAELEKQPSMEVSSSGVNLADIKMILSDKRPVCLLKLKDSGAAPGATPLAGVYADLVFAETGKPFTQHIVITPAIGDCNASVVRNINGKSEALKDVYITSSRVSDGYEIFCILPSDIFEGNGKELKSFRLDPTVSVHPVAVDPVVKGVYGYFLRLK